MLMLAGAAAACPMCKDSIPASDAQQAASLPGGFNASIFYMLGGLFGVMGLLATIIVKGVRSSTKPVNGFPITTPQN